jgi:hypothetical protein
MSRNSSSNDGVPQSIRQLKRDLKKTKLKRARLVDDGPDEIINIHSSTIDESSQGRNSEE